MAAFGIFEELLVTLKYYYEKKRSRNHVVLKLFTQQIKNSGILITRGILGSLSIYSMNF